MQKCVYKGISEEPAHISIIISKEKQNKSKINKIKFEFIRPPTISFLSLLSLASYYINRQKKIGEQKKFNPTQ